MRRVRARVLQRFLLSAIVVATPACADASSRLVARGEYDVTCRRDRQACLDEAAAICPNGFDVERGREEPGSVPIPNGYAVNRVSTYEGEVVVKCR